MRIRRCAILVFEPREELDFTLAGLLAGSTGVVRTLRWMALAPHLPAALEISIEARELLGTLSPSEWVERQQIAASPALVEQLIGLGLIVLENPVADAPQSRASHDDARLRRVHWHPLAALLHAFTRWSDVDTLAAARLAGTDTAAGLLARHGPPPAPAAHHDHSAISLPQPAQGAFDDLLQRRVTCRNFDPERRLPLALFSVMLARAFGVQGEVHSDGLAVAKKNVPSGGGLHPCGACLIVQNVEGLQPGLYRYQAQGHRLLTVAADASLRGQLVLAAVGQQPWFADAHCLVVLVAAFATTFWKYRRHDKAYRVVALDAGHISQTLYLSATELGLGAFITGAVNERPLEQAFGLDPLAEGVLAVCGFGWRAATQVAVELDPLARIWPRGT